jgi:hypothetical protein
MLPSITPATIFSGRCSNQPLVVERPDEKSRARGIRTGACLMAVLVKDLRPTSSTLSATPFGRGSNTLFSKTATERLGLGAEPDVGLFGRK